MFSSKTFLKVWSNLAFLIPLGTALYYNLYIYGFVVLCTMVVSTLYHYYDEKRYVLLDMFFANLLIVSNLYLCYLFGFAYPYFPLALVFVVIAFFFYFRQNYGNRYFNHAMWHMASVVITTSCIIGYGKLVI